MNFGGGWCGKCCWWGGATDEREMDGSRSKNGPRRQTGLLRARSTRWVQVGLRVPL